MLARRLLAALLPVLALGLTACEDEREIPEIESTGVRPIKTTVVDEPTQGRTRRFAGVVEAADTTRVSFEVGGTVETVAVGEGDRVAEGEVIARLDPEPYRIALENAKARLNEALSRRADAKDTFERRQSLVESGTVTEKSFRTARAAFEQAKAAVEAARAEVDQARRDLRQTKLKAPFAGRVASRGVDAYEDVRAGQPLFTLNSERGVEVSVSVPESAIARMEAGRAATLSFPTAGVREVPGRVTEVSGTAAEGGVYPVRVAPAQPTPGVEPGMTGEVRFTFETDEPAAFLIPVTAVLAHPDGQPKANVYVYDKDSGTVRKTAVRTRGITGNQIAVAEGLSAGDVIATAGVRHLHDGQEVTLLPDGTASE